MITKTQLRQISCVAIAALALGFVGLVRAIEAQESMPEYDQYGRWVNGITEPWSFRSERYSEAEATRARSSWAAIAQENEHAANEFAGDYRSGDLHGNFLRWSETGFVVMSVFTCEANVTEVDYGTVSASPSLIKLNVERQRQQHHEKAGHNHGRPSLSSLRLVPIKWGSERYLVPEREVGKFAEYLAGLGRFSGSGEAAEELDFYANSTGEQVDLFTTAPVFPRGYEKFLRQPIVGAITSVGRSYVRVNRHDQWWNDLIIPVTVDRGSTEGVRPGMGLYLVGLEDNETLEITRVSLHSAKGIIRRSVRKKPGVKLNQWDDGLPLEFAPIAVGLRFTSSLHQALSVKTTN